MTVVDRATLRQLAPPFLLAVAGFQVILLVNTIFLLAGFLASGALPAGEAALMLGYTTIPSLVIALPMSFTLATLLVLGRMARDGEITALRALGLGHRRIVAPILAGALAVGGLAYWLNDTAAPWANARFSDLADQAARRGDRPLVANDVFFRSADGRVYCFAGFVDRRDGVLMNLVVEDRRGPTRRVLTAPRGRWDGRTWRLEGGVASAYDRWGAAIGEEAFAATALGIGLELTPYFANRDRGPREKPSADLARDIAVQRAAGAAVRELEVEYHMKFALPLSTFFAAMMAAPLGVRASRAGGALAIAGSLGLILIYQVVMTVAHALGVNGWVDPVTGAWLQNWVFAALGAILLWLADR